LAFILILAWLTGLHPVPLGWVLTTPKFTQIEWTNKILFVRSVHWKYLLGKYPLSCFRNIPPVPHIRNWAERLFPLFNVGKSRSDHSRWLYVEKELQHTHTQPLSQKGTTTHTQSPSPCLYVCSGSCSTLAFTTPNRSIGRDKRGAMESRDPLRISALYSVLPLVPHYKSLGLPYGPRLCTSDVKKIDSNWFFFF